MVDAHCTRDGYPFVKDLDNPLLYRCGGEDCPMEFELDRSEKKIERCRYCGNTYTIEKKCSQECEMR